MSRRRFMDHETEGHASIFFPYFPLKKSFSPCYWFSQCNLWQAFNQITRNSIERQTHYVRDSLHKTQYGSVNCSRLPDASQRNFAIRSKRSLVAHEILRGFVCYRKQWRIQVIARTMAWHNDQRWVSNAVHSLRVMKYRATVRLFDVAFN